MTIAAPSFAYTPANVTVGLHWGLKGACLLALVVFNIVQLVVPLVGDSDDADFFSCVLISGR